MTLTPEQIREMDKITGLQSGGSNRVADLRALKVQQPQEKTTAEKILNFTGGEEIGRGLGQALAQKGTARRIEETQTQQFDIQGQLIKRIREQRDAGQDTSRLEGALRELNLDVTKTGLGAERQLNPEQLTNKQVIGDALQLGTTLASIGGVSGAGKKFAGKLGNVPGLTKQSAGPIQRLVGKITGSKGGILKGALGGLVGGATEGAISGAAFGAATGLQKDGDAGEVGMEALKGLGIGALTGGIFGGVIGGVSGGLKSRALRKEILNKQIDFGTKKKLDLKSLSPEKTKTVSIARNQGFDDVDIDFMMSMSPEDKLKADQMTLLADKASKNKRVLERPIDIAGDGMVEKLRFTKSINRQAGESVEAAAQSLKGQSVDVEPLRQKTLDLLNESGINMLDDGKLNFNKSVFKNTPKVQKEINKAISIIPDGSDAYDVHIFKKTLDEVLDFGTSGEGLKGKSANMLKAIRASADGVLDDSFTQYNTANSDFRATKTVLEKAEELFGRKLPLDSKERAGHLLRSIFSNNTQRPRTLTLLNQLDDLGNLYDGNFTDNLVDQALFSEILEDVYGSQATTSFRGEAEKAIRGASSVIEGLRNPVKGAGEVASHVASRLSGITPENKMRILRGLLK